MKHHDDKYRSADNRRPEEIEHDIERTRAELTSNIDAIQSKLTPGQMMDQAMSYARTSLPADFGSNLNHAIRENPIPVALIGLGAAWLMASGRNPGYMKSRHRANHSFSPDDDPHRPGSGFANEHGIDFHGLGDLDDHGVGGHVTGDHGGSSMHRAMGNARQIGRDLTGDVEEKSRNLKNRVSDTTHHLKERVSATAHGIKEKMSAAKHDLQERKSSMSSSFKDSSASMSERSHHMTDDMRMRASEMRHRSQEQYYRARSNFNHMLEEQPLVVGVLGLAVGALLGAMLPGTRREDELLGRTRDDLFEQGEKMAREQAGHLKASAQRVAETAKEEAQHLREEGQHSRNGHSYQGDEGSGTDSDTGRDTRSLH